MRTVNYNYDYLSQSEFIKKITFVIFCLTNNVNFSALPVSPGDINIQLTNYINMIVKSLQGDHVAVKNALAIRKIIAGMIKQNGIYVNQTANGDVTKLESSGYNLSKEKTYTEKPEVYVEQSDQSGAGKIFIKAQEDALTYLVFHTDTLPDPWNDEKKWIRLPLTSKHYLWVTGVEPGKDNWLMYSTSTTGGETPMKGPFKFKLL